MQFSLSSLSKLKLSHSAKVLVLAVSLLGLATANPLATNPVVAQQKMIRTLTVTGKGVEEIPTTLTQVTLGVQAQGKTADAVQQEVARRTTAVVTLLKSRQVEKLETTGINLSPTYSYENNQQKLTGYQASNMVSFRIVTEKSGSLLDDAVKAGASRIDGISFVATDPAIAAAQKQALREATQDAQQQADAVLSALQLTRREIVSIQINNATPPQPLVMAAEVAVMSVAKRDVTPVIGGEQKVEANVTLQISY